MADKGRKCRTVRRNAGRMATLVLASKLGRDVEMCLLLRHSLCFDYSLVSRCLLRSR